MSLLLEALKKAELAKQGAQPEAGPGQAAEQPAHRAGPRADEMTLVQEPRVPVITRESLPDISQPLEIRSEDLPSTARNAEQSAQRAAQRIPEPALERPAVGLGQRATATERPTGSAGANGTDATQMRDAARQVFDVKEVDYNPRRPFYFTIAALLIAGGGYGGYVWWQMQPHYTVNAAAVSAAAASKPPDAAMPAAADSAAGQAAPPTQSLPPVAPASAQPPAVPAPKLIEPVPGAQAEPAPGAPTFRATRAAALRAAEITVPAREPAARRSQAAEAPISIMPASVQPDPALQAAYGSYGRGEWQTARDQYQRVLERDPGNRDALLGLAAIDVREHSYETAELRYLKLLEFNPRDTYAFAGLMALQGNVDPVQSESRIKTLLATQPDATHLYFTLGNQYAAQGRWSEAQDAYFKAYSSNPQNPDYAFNLAVSLDHLRQSRLALEYYRKALASAQQQPAAFSRPQAQARATELER